MGRRRFEQGLDDMLRPEMDVIVRQENIVRPDMVGQPSNPDIVSHSEALVLSGQHDGFRNADGQGGCFGLVGTVIHHDDPVRQGNFGQFLADEPDRQVIGTVTDNDNAYHGNG
jgi:hypothetical protein